MLKGGISGLLSDHTAGKTTMEGEKERRELGKKHLGQFPEIFCQAD